MNRFLDGYSIFKEETVPPSRQTSIVPANRIHLDSRKVLITDQPRHPPKVTINRDDDLIRSIEVHCSCGEHVILDCEYDSAKR